MAHGYFNAQIIGNLGTDPETKTLKSGNTVCSFSVAVNGRDENGEDKVTWVRVSAWGKTGELCQQFLAKGRQVFVAGRLSQREYEDKNGVKRTSLELNAEGVQFIGGADKGGQGGGNGGGNGGGAQGSGYNGGGSGGGGSGGGGNGWNNPQGGGGWGGQGQGGGGWGGQGPQNQQGQGQQQSGGQGGWGGGGQGGNGWGGQQGGQQQGGGRRGGQQQGGQGRGNADDDIPF